MLYDMFKFIFGVIVGFKRKRDVVEEEECFSPLFCYHKF